MLYSVEKERTDILCSYNPDNQDNPGSDCGLDSSRHIHPHDIQYDGLCLQTPEKSRRKGGLPQDAERQSQPAAVLEEVYA